MADEVNRPAVEVTALTKKFDGRTVLDGMDLTIGAGEFVALLGKSGSGKSTLLRILAGLDDEHDGDSLVRGEVSVAFQQPRLLPWRKVWRNLVLGLRRDADREHAVGALSEVRLEERADAWPGTLSGGEAQRVSLARALIREPDVLLLDEPFGALDALTRLEMRALVSQLWLEHRPAVLLVTHDVTEALALADRVLVLDDGRITAQHAIDLPRPRDPRALGDLNSQLLGELGVREDVAV